VPGVKDTPRSPWPEAAGYAVASAGRADYRAAAGSRTKTGIWRVVFCWYSA